MEDKIESTRAIKSKTAVKSGTAITGQMKKISTESAKLLTTLRERANKKTFGRRVKESEILDVAIKLVTNEHLKAIQESTYSAQDRLRLRHEDYQRRHGKLSFDNFIEKWMNGELLK